MGSSKALAHEPSLCEGDPPLAGGTIRKNLFHETGGGFLSKLGEVTPELIRLCPTRRRGVEAVEREVGIAGKGEAIHRVGGKLFVGLVCGPGHFGRGDLGETVGDEEDEVDEDAVGGALDFKVAEERIGAEEVDAFVDDVWARRVDGRWSGSARARTDGKK